MLFKQKHLEAIKAGKISLAFRKWKKCAVTKGSLVKTSVGLIKIGSVEVIKSEDISDDEARKAGFSEKGILVQLLSKEEVGVVYRIGVEYHSEDPRIDLREKNMIPEDEFLEIQSALDRLDKHSKLGKWTTDMLIAIKANPKLKAADLAVKARKEKEWLKLNVRKLKNLGLTISHEPGYTLSPRGEEYLNRITGK
ncbi:hypothetical protein DYBT9275_00420 [Dyadobacter sp. CECT 9275]|uniref:ASCH domain-containing protein n=1 Tax=Dyadobacter helix TaxID=2822344 RepID=A0A916J8J1_9BACT|nr:ASCH domain-containing protein [Dyadobacter sp. CECT 9275]CAG4989978.1 hypothetical protein DYBT9275_00420 [Dyadobacter sp. CECT 9275]